MIISNIIFFLALAGAAYFVNYVAKFYTPLPKLMCNVFLGIVFLMWVLGLFGVGR
jgi:hypothetical protein